MRAMRAPLPSGVQAAMNTIESPYVKETLSATKSGLADPRPLVEEWLREAEDLLYTDRRAGPQPELAGRLIAARLRLRRVRPELICGAAERQLMDALEAWFAEDGSRACAMAAKLDVAAWERDAQLLDESYEQDWEPDVRADLAKGLLARLDDAQLVALARQDAGLKDPDYEEQLERCDAWCLLHADMLLAASTHVQAIGLALRPDLLDVDPSLALTAVKFEAVLRAAVDMEQDLSLRCTPELAEAFGPLLEDYRAAHPPVVLVRSMGQGHSAALLPKVVLLAAEEPEKAPRLLWWQSPDGSLRACVALPERVCDESHDIVVAFSTADDRPAQHLAGSTVNLAGVAAIIGSDAKARWPLQAIRQSGADLVLEVGSPPVAWQPVA